ncbi:MAG: hypothetical protein FJ396_14290 [Verrucomicrobia bacterium]|nr:hypothetical protein [Verrucomicrobiota bacterium]
MDIQSTGAFDNVSKVQKNISRRDPTVPRTDEQDFSQTDALRGALDNLPRSRPEKIEQARELVGQVDYPPAQTIRKISDLLAVKMKGPLAL